MTIFKKARKRSWLAALIIAPATFLVAFVISSTNPLQTIEYKVIDQMFELRGPLSVEESPIVLVSISEQADSEIPYKFPWPTRYYAKLVENLNEAGAKVIGFDVIFSKPDNYSHENDSMFADALREYGNVVLAGNLNREQFRGSSRITPVEPIPLLKRANPNPYGFVKVPTNIDGFVREYILAEKYLNEFYFPFGLEVLRVYENLDSVEVQNSDNYFSFGPFDIPKVDGRTMLINYHGGPSTFPMFSFDQVVDDSTITLNMEKELGPLNSFDDPEMGLKQKGVFENKIVLVGATMSELHDFYNTPFAASDNENRQMTGFEVHANAIQTILSDRYLDKATALQNMLIIALFSLIVAFGTIYTKAIPAFFMLILQSIGYVVAVYWSFVEYNYIIAFTGPLIALVLGYVGTVTYDYLAEQKEKARIRNMFASYVSPDLVTKMIESGEEPQLGGDEVYITAFFSDIQSFSSFSEQLEPKELVDLINEYLTAMTDILTDEGGTLDKYIGDAIVAFFGAPYQLDDHAYRACISSQLMQRKIKELRQKWRAEGDKWPKIVWEMQNRIGINTGWMVTGNMGSTSRFNYTMMGDSVNLAARCESGAKSYGVYTMITEDTKKEADKFGDECVFRYLDQIVVKGRTQPVKIYEIMDLRDDMNAEKYKCIELFEEGIQYYMNQEWNRAISQFEQAADYEPNLPGETPGVNTNPSLIFIDRCNEMMADPPPADWNGVYVMKTK